MSKKTNKTVAKKAAKKAVAKKSAKVVKPAVKKSATRKVAANAAKPAPKAARTKPVNYLARAWEGVTAQKAVLFHPELDPGFLENKFRWGAFKAFAFSKGEPIPDITHPAASANGAEWLVTNKYAKREGEGSDTVLKLTRKGATLYKEVFKGKTPKDFQPSKLEGTLAKV